MNKEKKLHLRNVDNAFGLHFAPATFLTAIQEIMPIFNCYIFTNKSLLREYISFSEKNNYKWDLLIWSKPNPVPINNGHYLIDKEYIVYIKQSGAYFNSSLDYEKYYTVKSFPIGQKNKHPTQKDVSLLVNPLLISTKEQDLILDPFAGSGTTAIVCIRYNRRYILIEKEEKYCEIAAKRIESELQQAVIDL